MAGPHQTSSAPAEHLDLFDLGRLPAVLIFLGYLRYCIRIRTRGEIHALRKSRGLRSYFTAYPDLSPNMDIIPFLTMIY